MRGRPAKSTASASLRTMKRPPPVAVRASIALEPADGRPGVRSSVESVSPEMTTTPVLFVLPDGGSSARWTFQAVWSEFWT